MKSYKKLSVIIFLGLFTCSCAVTSTVRIANQGNIKSPIEMANYSIFLSNENSWKDWALTKDIELDTLTIEKLRTTPFGKIKGSTSISILPGKIDPLTAKLPLEKRAAQILDQEEQTMISQGAEKGEYELSNVLKQKRKVGQKNLNYMTWEATKGTKLSGNLKWKPFIKGAFYVYFPENFNEIFIFYRFVIIESYVPLTRSNIDIETILPVIDGFQLKQNKS